MSGVLRELLRTDEGILRQLQCYLFVFRIYLPAKRQYERQIESNRQQQQQKHLNEAHSAPRWDFPPFPWTFRAYNIISNILLGWVLFKFLFPTLFIDFGRLVCKLTGLESGQPLPGHCYVFGKLVIHYELSIEMIGALLASFHLIWRLAQQLLDRPFFLEAALFLMQPKSNIEQFIQRRLNSSTGSLIISSENRARGQLTSYELFLCQIMCFKVTYGHDDGVGGQQRGTVVFKLRPNRSLEARELLVASLVDMTIKLLSLMGLIVIVFAVYITFVILFNQHRYQNAYPGCYPRLAQLYRAGNLSRWSAVPPVASPHYVAAMCFDAIENVTVWVEGGLVVVFGLIFVAYLNSDLVAYWTHLSVKVRSLLIRSKQVSEFHGARRAERQQLNQDIYQLQWELCDFFRQINRVDLLISDVITHGHFIWITGFGFTWFEAARVYVNGENIDFGLVTMSLLIPAFANFALACAFLLALQRACKLSYANICSLMAYDQTRHKRRFIRIVDFYTSKNHTCYTLFQQYPFSSSKFAQIIGWSLSCFIVLDSIFHRR